jgi:hypothetical protein
MTPKLKKIILMIVIAGILFLVYVMFFKKQDVKESLITGSNALSGRTVKETKLLGNQITQALVQIESLNLDRNVIDSKLFKSLIDRSEPIISEPIGRRNPFAPLSDTSVNYNSGVASTTNATTTRNASTTTQTLPIITNATETQSTTTRTSATSSNFLPNTGL